MSAQFLGVRLLTQAVVPTTKEVPVPMAAIGAPAGVSKEIQCRHRASHSRLLRCEFRRFLGVCVFA